MYYHLFELISYIFNASAPSLRDERKRKSYSVPWMWEFKKKKKMHGDSKRSSENSRQKEFQRKQNFTQRNTSGKNSRQECVVLAKMQLRKLYRPLFIDITSYLACLENQTMEVYSKRGPTQISHSGSITWIYLNFAKYSRNIVANAGKIYREFYTNDKYHVVSIIFGKLDNGILATLNEV